MGATEGTGGTLNGAGSLAAPDVTQGVKATLAGAGSLTAADVQGSGATLAGAGSLTTAVTLGAVATLAGAGSLTAAVTQGVIAALNGAGSLTAAAGGNQAGGGTLNGAGSLTAPDVTQGVTAATLAGAGSLNTLALLQATATLAGAGSLTAAGGALAAFTIGALTATDARQSPYRRGGRERPHGQHGRAGRAHSRDHPRRRHHRRAAGPAGRPDARPGREQHHVSKITDYGALTAALPDDVIPVVDVHDTSMAASGTTKKITVSGLFISGQFLCAPTQYAPGVQTLLTVNSTTMAAFSSANVNTGAFTAPPSGTVMVTASFVMVQSVSGGGAFGLAAHGTLTPILGNEWIIRDSAATIPRSYALEFLVTGLTPGASLNFDLMGCMTSTDTMSIEAIGVTSTTPTLTLAGSGGPVIMTVRAV